MIYKGENYITLNYKDLTSNIKFITGFIYYCHTILPNNVDFIPYNPLLSFSNNKGIARIHMNTTQCLYSFFIDDNVHYDLIRVDMDGFFSGYSFIILPKTLLGLYLLIQYKTSL